MANYEVSWTETSNHRVQLTSRELAKLLGVTSREVDEDPDGFDSQLSDALAELDDDGLEFLTREDIEVTRQEG